MNKAFKPTETELEILRILWENGASTVRFVNEVMNKQRKVGMTTTLKIMQIMTDKELLVKNDSKRPHTFCPTVNESNTKDLLIDKLLDSAFGGSTYQLVMQALGNHKSSKEELAMIKDFLTKIEKED